MLSGEAQWVAEADIKSYFDTIDHTWLMRMIELRVGEAWILRLIRKWLGAGVLDQGTVTTPEEGTPQGGPLSPLLANIYLHYALDLWFTRVVLPRCRGAAKLVRFADDYVALFELEQDAERFAAVLLKRLAKFGLTLAEEKTKRVPFGRSHWVRGQSYKHFFDLLGFRHHLGTNHHGRMTVVRVPSPKSVRKFLSGIKTWLQHHLHDRPAEQQRVLTQKLRDFYQYLALYHTLPKLG